MFAYNLLYKPQGLPSKHLTQKTWRGPECCALLAFNKENVINSDELFIESNEIDEISSHVCIVVKANNVESFWPKWRS